MSRSGFTLVELSVVLVIIGLLVGGILVGRDLIRTSEIRAQITQIEEIKTAANTFKLKYNELPGDISSTNASSFGFAARNGTRGWGDGNGILEGYGTVPGLRTATGELCLFWVDLSAANLIKGNYKGGSETSVGNVPCTTFQFVTAYGDAINSYFPKAKLGANYIYTWSGGVSPSPPNPNTAMDGNNYIEITAVSSVSGGWANNNPGLSVMDAFNIDTKIDDGLPNTGSALAAGTLLSAYWSNNQATDTPITCFNQSEYKYSTSQNKGEGINCSLSFRIK